MYCKNCGSVINEGQRFCPKCGTEVFSVEKNQKEKSSYDLLNSNSSLLKTEKFAKRFHINAVVLTCVSLGIQIVTSLFWPSTSSTTFFVSIILLLQLFFLTTKNIGKLKITSGMFLGFPVLFRLLPNLYGCGLFVHLSDLFSVYSVIILILMAIAFAFVCFNVKSINRTMSIVSIILLLIITSLLSYDILSTITGPETLYYFHQIAWTLEFVTLILIELISNFTYSNDLDPNELFRKRKNDFNRQNLNTPASSYNYNNSQLSESSSENRGSRGIDVFLNIVWAILGGIIDSLLWFISGILWCITIVGIPLGKQCFKFAKLAIAPFGKDIIFTESTAKTIVNIIWIIFTGLWYSLAYVILGVVFCVTIIGIPFGLQYFKFAKLMLMPFGAKIVDKQY